MRAELSALVHGAFRRLLGLKVTSYSSFQALVEKAAQSNRLQSEVATLESRLDGLRSDLESARTEVRILQARADWSDASNQQSLFRQLRSIGATLRSRPDPVPGSDRGVRTVGLKPAVVVATSSAQITQIKALIGSARVRAVYELIVVAYFDVGRSEIRDYCAQHGVTLLSHEFETVSGGLLVPSAETDRDHFAETLDRNLSARIETLEERDTIRDIGRLASEVRRQMIVYRRAERFVRDVGARLLILFEDNAEHETGVWTTIAQQNSIASVILPYTIVDKLEPAEAHFHDRLFWADEGSHNRLASTAMPHWLFRFRDRWLLRRSGAAIIAAEAIGVAPPAPWILNSTKADAIAVESEAMRTHYLNQGIPKDQLELTGSTTDDLLYDAQADRVRLQKVLGLDPEKRTLLCSMPPNQLSATRPECEFHDFAGIADFWLGELAGLQGWQVLIKPHPSMGAADIDYLRNFGLPVLTEHDTPSLIPLCDLYNPSVSSTIRWALACGKPVLNYDVFKYRYQDFVAEPAVLTVFTAAEFSAALRRLVGDKAVLENSTAHARAAATRWGMLDGQSMQRIVGLFDRLTAQPHAGACAGH